VKILFYDTAAIRPYDPDVLRREGLGGTEATVVRVAEALAEKHEVVVSQKCRHAVFREKAFYEPERWQDADAVVVLRNPLDCSEFQNPVLWMHDFVQVDEFTDEEKRCLENAEIVAVSDWHKANLEKSFTQKVTRIYNPCKVERRGFPKKPGKLIFCSSPHKGLDKTLDVMGEILERDRSFTLYIANPGYWSSSPINTKYVKTLGSLRHLVLLKHLEESVCMLQANDVFPETFGLVYAEAKAVGTPVLTYAVGAAEEVYGPCVPEGASAKEFADQFFAGLETPEPDPRFDLDVIASQWLDLLG